MAETATVRNTERRKTLSGGKRLQEKLKQAAAGKKISGLGVQARFMVTGGTHGERFFECTDLDSDGHVLYESEDQLRRRPRRKIEGYVATDAMRKVFADLRNSGLVGRKHRPQQILPDTLVGCLTVRSGRYEEMVVFPVDEPEPKMRRPRAMATLKLHSGKELVIAPTVASKRLIKAAYSLCKLPEVLAKRSPQRPK